VAPKVLDVGLVQPDPALIILPLLSFFIAVYLNLSGVYLLVPKSLGKSVSTTKQVGFPSKTSGWA